MKLAPDVAAFIEYWSASRFGGRINGIDAEGLLTQLRALLRVARAAGRDHQGWPDGECIVELDIGSCPVCNALRALDRASGRGENEGER
jgi:hypothetical protein